MVPSGWKKGVIEDIAKVSSGGTPSRKNDSYWIGGQIPWVTTTEVQFGVINNTEQKITEAGLKNSSAKLFPRETILMAMYGQGKTRGQVAKLGIEASTNQACAALLLNDGFEVDYYYQYLVSQYENIRELANSGGQQNLSAGIIKSIHVPIPPLSEQRKIAKILATWDKAISTTERLIDNSKQQKKALMQQLLTGKKRLLDDSGKPFEGEWEEVKVGSLITKHSEKTNRSGQYPVLTSSRKGIMFQSHYYNNRDVASEDNTGYNVVPRGFFTYRHMSDDLVFKFNINTICDRGIVSTLYPVFAAKENKVIPYFLQLILNEGSEFKRFSLAQKQGGSRTYMYLSKLNDLKIYIPNISEQQKIASVLTNADKEIELLEQQLTDLKQEKKALMQQLLTGKRRVKVDDEAVA